MAGHAIGHEHDDAKGNTRTDRPSDPGVSEDEEV
jgi:hypothetical protein